MTRLSGIILLNGRKKEGWTDETQERELRAGRPRLMAGPGGYRQRLLKLREILERRTDEDHPMSVPALVEALDREGIKAERKALYDDLAALEESGLDLLHRDNGGYYVAERGFQLSELKLLVDAVESSRFITRTKSDELIGKLAALASEHEAAGLKRNVHVSGRIKAMNETIYYNVDAISGAIAAGRQISFRYFNWRVNFDGGERFVKEYRRAGERYTVSPWALIWAEENYYLAAYTAGDAALRHYRVDKMENIRMERAHREGAALAEHLDAGTYSRSLFGMFGGEEETFRLRFANRLAGVVADRFGRDVFLVPDGEDHFIAHLSLTPSAQFYGWLVGLEGEAEILFPAAQREKFQKLCEALADPGGKGRETS